MPELSRNKLQFKCMGLAVRVCQSLFHFISIIVGFVTLTKNMNLIEVVLARTGVFRTTNNAFEECLLYLSCSLFLHRFRFRSVRMALVASGSPFTLLPPPRTQCTNYKCAVKINNSIKFNCPQYFTNFLTQHGYEPGWRRGKDE